ncbi:MAG: BACON domain-containing protein [Ekhidna sp.]|nr:BACON domain-containing protein [Ekhidna sp.]
MYNLIYIYKLSIGLALIACGDDDKEEPVNTAPVMSDRSFTIAEDAETGAAMGTMIRPVEIALAESSLSILADIAVEEWTVSSNVDWLRAEKVDNEMLRVSHDQNTSTESREGIVTASIGDISDTINVTQARVYLDTDLKNPDIAILIKYLTTINKLL